MPARELSGTTALVTGASRGFGRAVAVAIAVATHGANVVGVARGRARLEELGAKATIRFIASYAAAESGRNAPGISDPG
jgi:NAD(P)-dependent dehydrogenase (short-subunit alcohol dehydrogenase family)